MPGLISRSMALCLVTLHVLSCSDEEGTAIDAGDSRVSDSQKKTAPAAAQAPRFVDWSCPAGWSSRKVAAGSVVAHSVCTPPPRLVCPDGDVQVLGQPSCKPIGTSCPAAGSFLPPAAIRALTPGYTGKIVYVKAGVTGGDGREGKPLGSIADALSRVAAKDVIALYAGKHQESAIIGKAVALVGSCVKGTTIHSLSTHPGMLALKVTTAGVLVSNLQITGLKAGVLIQGVTGKVGVSDVEIKGGASVAIMTALGSPDVALDRVVIRDAVGVGIALGGSVKVDARDLVLERIQGFGILVGASTLSSGIPQVKLADLVIRDVTQGPSTNEGAAIRIEAPANLTISRCLLKAATDIGVVLAGAGNLALTDCQLIDTRAGLLKQGRGLMMFDGSKVTMTRTVVENNLLTALHVWGSGAGAPPKLELTDVVIRATGANVATGEAGCGLVVAGDVSGRRVLLEENADAAILVAADKQAALKVLSLTDLAVLDTRGRKKDKGRGAGLVMDGGKISLERALFAGNRSHAIIAGLSSDSAAPELTLTDLIVRDTRVDEGKKLYGRGLEIQGSKLSITRALLERNRDIALLITRATNKQGGVLATVATLRDLIIQDTRSDTSSPLSGQGLVVQDGALVTASWLVSRRNHGTGLLAVQKSGAGSVKVDLTDVEISHTGRSACAAIARGQPGSCVKGGVTFGGGSGLSVVGKVVAVVDRFDIHDNKLCGVQVASGGALTIKNGSLHHNTIGINAAGQGVDIKALLGTTVRVYDNDTNVDSSVLPVPDAAKTLAGLGF